MRHENKLQSVADAMKLVNERNKFRDSMKSHWFEIFKVPASNYTVSLLSRYAQEHGEDSVRHWIDLASGNEITANQALRYITAIKPKNELEGEV